MLGVFKSWNNKAKNNSYISSKQVHAFGIWKKEKRKCIMIWMEIFAKKPYSTDTERVIEC